MKNMIRLLIVFVILSITLAGCLDPVSVLTNTSPTPSGGRVRELPGPTTEPAGTATRSAGPLDTGALIREPATVADQVDEKLINTVDIPIADLRELAIRFKGVPADAPLKNCTTAPTYNVGDQEKFTVVTADTMKTVVVDATLIAKSDKAYMWLDNMFVNHVNLDAFKQALQTFSDKIMPRDHALFGQEESPGVDCDSRVHILNTSSVLGANVGGYVTEVDRVTKQVRSDSNEKNMVYVNIEGSGGPSEVGTDYYHGTLAHEFQHLIQQNHDVNEDTWVSEGMSELAQFLNGNDDQYDAIAAQTPDIQLNSWPVSGGAAGPDVYGTAFSFMLYFWDRYGDAGVQALAAEPANGLAGVQNTLNKIDPGKAADELVADWLIARLLDDPSIGDGRYGYSNTDRAKVEPRPAIGQYPFAAQSSVHQYAGDYTEFHGARDLSIDFAGSTKAQLIDAQPHSGQYFLWSNRADVADLHAQHEFDLSGVKNATLKYWTWYDLEKDWDYAYLSVSEDGGQTWKLVKAPSMTDSNPSNSNYGWGYTNKSGGGDRAEWIQESVDLSPYAGKKIVVSFDVINDLAVNRPGVAIDDVEVPEINYQSDFEKDDGGWQTAGWIRTNNFVPQRYVVQLISFGKDGKIDVSQLPVKADNTAKWNIPLSQLEKAVVVVSPMASKTTEVARYSWSAQEK
jgi:immune inhibitor A